MDAIGSWLQTLPDLWQGNRLLRAASLIVASIVLARISEWILDRVLARWAKRTSSHIDDELLARVRRPVFLTILVTGLWLTTKYLALAGGFERITLGILGTLLTLSWLTAAIGVLSLFLEATSQRQRFRLIEPHTRPLFENLGKVVLLGAAAYLLTLIWRIDPTPWLASAGIVGIAIGFAAKDTLANLFAGVFIFADTPYKIGDYINLDSGERGEVTAIGLRSTRLLTRDDVEITIPNAVIANAKIVNESGGPSPRYRVRVRVGVAYGSDIDRVREVLLAVADTAANVCNTPEPRVRFRGFGGSSLDHELLCWIEEPVLRGRVLDALNSEVYRRFAEEGIEIPYSKQDVYIKEWPAREASPGTEEVTPVRPPTQTHS